MTNAIPAILERWGIPSEAIEGTWWDWKERLLLDIYEGVFGLLQDRHAERDWIRIQRPELDRRSLLDLIRSGSQPSSLLRAKAFVDMVSGR